MLTTADAPASIIRRAPAADRTPPMPMIATDARAGVALARSFSICASLATFL